MKTTTTTAKNFRKRMKKTIVKRNQTETMERKREERKIKLCLEKKWKGLFYSLNTKILLFHFFPLHHSQKFCWLFSLIPSNASWVCIHFPHSCRETEEETERERCKHSKYCLHSPKKKQKEKGMIYYSMYIKRIIILHAIETIHIAWMKKVLRNLPKMYQNLMLLHTVCVVLAAAA